MTPDPLQYARLRSQHLAARRALAEAERRMTERRRVRRAVGDINAKFEAER